MPLHTPKSVQQDRNVEQLLEELRRELSGKLDSVLSDVRALSAQHAEWAKRVAPKLAERVEARQVELKEPAAAPKTGRVKR